MDWLDPDKVLRQTFVRRLVCRPEVDSTNDVALQLAFRQAGDLPLLVVAERQLRGRGRGANRWWSAPGSLTFSLATGREASAIASRQGPQVSLTTGLAVCHAIGRLLPQSDLQLKWPNDVYLRGRKVCGILVESSPAHSGALIIGIGINASNSLVDAPPDVQPVATSLVDAGLRQVDRTQLLVDVLNELEDCLSQLKSSNLGLSDQWRTRCMLQGRTLRIESGNRVLVGVCQGIDDEGALLVQTDLGVRRCHAGVVAKIY
jgi:BirA family biotin operon repressor/biotin-[acetyl-CoA-carboxylase] ligase